MTEELEDWQLALLVEARRYSDPVIVEAAEAKDLQDAQDMLEQAEGIDSPVVVDREVKQTFDEASELLEAASGIDEWELVESDERAAEQEALEAVEELLSDALKEHHDLRDSVVDTMGAPAMVNQFRDEDDGEVELEALAQQPETGGADPQGDGGSGADDDGGDDPDDDPNPVDALSADERKAVRENLEKADMMTDRTPDYAETLRTEAKETLGVDDLDEIDREDL